MPNEFLICLGIAALVMTLGVVPLMGLPGALVCGLAEPAARRILGLPPDVLLKGDRAWPAALYMTLLWPPGLPALDAPLRLAAPDAPWPWMVVALALGLYVWAVVLLAWLARPRG